MKKILIFGLLALIIGSGAFLANRYANNPTSVAPYPYSFAENAQKEVPIDAPIHYCWRPNGRQVASFSKIMAAKISENLSRPIKIQSIAAKGEGLHRTLHKIKNLKKLPLIIIYFGGSEERSELKFKTRDIPAIKENIDIFQDDTAQTAMMIWPPLSRISLHPY